MNTTLTIFLNKEKTAFQIVRPKMQGENRFNGNWHELVIALTGGDYHSFDIS